MGYFPLQGIEFMIKDFLKKQLRKLPEPLAVRAENTARRILRFFDGRDISAGLLNFNTLPCSHGIRKLPEKTPLALVYNVYYQHSDFSEMEKQLRKYEKFSPDILRLLTIIIVDDGSKIPIELPDVNLNITLLRIQEDIPWNGGGARNLGACYTTIEKILFCDIDHFVPKETIRNCMEADIRDNELYLLEWESPVYVPPNIFCMRRHTFLQYHGYDEEFSGYYGDDVFFRRYLEKCGINFIRTGWKIRQYEKKPFLGEHHLSRSLLTAKRKFKKWPFKQHSCHMLRFPWMIVSERSFQERDKEK